MLERHWVVLKGGEQIRLGQMPGVAGLGEQAKIGEAQTAYQLLFPCPDFSEMGRA